MKKQHYIQVWIESEDDLPKVNGYYFYKHKKSYGDGSGMLIYMEQSDKKYWLENIDWYLAEVEPKGLTDEEIENEFPYVHSYCNMCKQMGAKWARDQMQDNQSTEEIFTD